MFLVVVRIVIPVVAGSSPVVHPIKSITYRDFELLESLFQLVTNNSSAGHTKFSFYII